MKPRIPRGTRDFLPIEVRRRNYIFETVSSVFENYGYVPIETPAMEDLRTLTGKYGDEGDTLLFKILNNGDFLRKANKEALEQRNSGELVSSISKRGLRYDLTVPFSRYVVMNQNELQFPFKRYQIQPVWRADRPQKGRYREFYQCDVDVIGSESRLCEAELMDIYQDIFGKLDLDVTIRVSNRKILTGIAEYAGVEDKLIPMTVAIDKMDKIGMEGVKNELEKAEMDIDSISRIEEVLTSGDMETAQSLLKSSDTASRGFSELNEVFDYLGESTKDVQFDITLARGLDYYTGFICEVNSNESEMGSIGGGGRYDNLTEMFGLKNMSGVGVSLGAERIYDIMLELGKFPDSVKDSANAIFVSFDEESLKYSYKMAQELRQSDIAVDIYPEATKIGKQMKYADQRGFKYAVLVGSNERQADRYLLRNMKSGDEKLVDAEELKRELKIY